MFTKEVVVTALMASVLTVVMLVAKEKFIDNK
jgi:hypothetical protein